jgi:hypothetical protein
VSLTLDDVLDLLADKLADRIARRGTATVYSSVSLPPGIKRRAFNERCRGIPEARKDGVIWSVSVDAYDRAVRRGPQPRKATAAAVEPANDDAMELLRQAGAKRRRAGGSR